jgi:[ribosomal protein S18]-alanine N-acetyltransferase
VASAVGQSEVCSLAMRTAPEHATDLSFEIALATHDDAADIVSIDELSFRQPTTDPAAELERPWARLWVAKPSGRGRAAAFLLVWFAADEMHVLTLATLADFRRRGLGRALMMHALDEARLRGTRLVLLEVRRSNQAAVELYRDLGFAIVGVRTRYYLDGEDAMEMGLVLDAGTGERDRGRG